MKMRLSPLSDFEVELRTGLKSTRRNALGWIRRSELRSMLTRLKCEFERLGVGHDLRDETTILSRKGGTILLTSETNEGLTQVERLRNERKLRCPLGFLIEPVTAGINEKGVTITDEERYAIWVPFNVKGVVLTAFRRWCLDNLFETRDAEKE